MPYLNVIEVESALSVAASAPYTSFTQLISLPNLTWEGRQCHALRIAGGSGASRPGVYFLGGVHAREWGSADILINFVEQLEEAYHNGTGLTFGSRTFSVSDIQTIVNTLDIIVFPQANPDGRNHSMNADAMWRKNRRTASGVRTTRFLVSRRRGRRKGNSSSARSSTSRGSSMRAAPSASSTSRDLPFGRLPIILPGVRYL
jgi:carboxypeptidase T